MPCLHLYTFLQNELNTPESLREKRTDPESRPTVVTLPSRRRTVVEVEMERWTWTRELRAHVREAGGDRTNRASSPVSSRLVNSASAEARGIELRLIALAEQ